MGKSEKNESTKTQSTSFFNGCFHSQTSEYTGVEEFIFKNSYYWYFTNKIFPDNFTFTQYLHTSDEGTQHRRFLQSKDDTPANSLVVQWLGLRSSTAGIMNLIPGQGTKIPQASKHGQKKKDDTLEKARLFLVLISFKARTVHVAAFRVNFYSDHQNQAEQSLRQGLR